MIYWGISALRLHHWVLNQILKYHNLKKLNLQLAGIKQIVFALFNFSAELTHGDFSKGQNFCEF